MTTDTTTATTTTPPSLETILMLFPLPGPGVNPFDMSFGSVARLHAGEPVTVAAYKAEKERVRVELLNRVKQVKQFSVQRAELALEAWDAWIWAAGSFRDAAEVLSEKIGRTFSRQAVYHHIDSLMRAGIIPRHRTRKPSRSRGEADAIALQSCGAEVESVAETV